MIEISTTSLTVRFARNLTCKVSSVARKGAICLLFAAISLPTIADEVDSKNWPQFRGLDSTGVSNNQGLPDKWSATENVEWKMDLPGRGWGSPVVWGERIYLSSVINSGETEPIRKGLYFGGDRPNVPESTHQWKVMCMELASGKTVWEKTVREGSPTGPIHLKNSYASESPITDGKRVYFCFGNVGIFCFDLEGNPLWQFDLEPRKMRLGWGTAASPVLHANTLYFVFDNDEASSLIAIDCSTGKQKWSIARDEKSNWATPFVWTNSQRTEIVTPGTKAVRSYDLEGKELWSLRGMSSITIATPYAVDGLLYVSSGYIMDPIKAMYAIKPGAAGDITLAKDETSNEHILWSSMKVAPYNPSTLVHNDRLYILYDRGMLSCLNAKTGELYYANKNLKRGTAYTTSPWCYDGKIFCLNEDGECSVIREGNALEILHTNTLAADDVCLSTPAITGDRLLLRTDVRLYCIRLSR